VNSAFIVVDLGFGDAGKGLITDYLVRRHGARLVVRFNGGAQAGHNVVTDDGRHHTFSQLGSGTLVPGVKTHLSRGVVVHPTALGVEADRLQALGERDVLERLSVDPRCLITTPFQQAAGRLREILRGATRHGSCGVGFGETVADALEVPALSVYFHELRQPERLKDRLFAQRELKLGTFAEQATGTDPRLERELSALRDPELPERWLRAAAEVAGRVATVEDEALEVPAQQPVVFEGAQGVLLDERFGFHPFTTWSRTTPEKAAALAAHWKLDRRLTRIGVLRTHAVRHGPGPLPTEDEIVVARTTERHNADGEWQGRVRKGWPDLVLLRYALRACGGVDTLAVTHHDALDRFATYRVCERYEGLDDWKLPANLAGQARLTELLGRARPRYTAIAPAEWCETVRALTRLAVGYVCNGPSASAVSEP
jgi:adenylosuccinate synthase